MKPVIKNILAVFAGIFFGSLVNMGIIYAGMSLIPLPDGINVSDPESLKAGMHLMETRHFIVPFLAHAIGTFAGAALAAKLAANHKHRFAFLIGVYFLFMGIINMKIIGSPLNFNVVDGLLAYLPMGWLAGRLFWSKNQDIKSGY